MSGIITSAPSPAGFWERLKERKLLVLVLAATAVAMLATGGYLAVFDSSKTAQNSPGAATETVVPNGDVSGAPGISGSNLSGAQLDNDLQNLNGQISGLDDSLNDTGSSMNDQQTDLSDSQ